jgi:hypothetical protein
LAESRKGWGEENKICATLLDIDKNTVAREVLGDGNVNMFGFEIKSDPKFSAGEKNNTAGIFYREGCRIMSCYPKD